MRKTGMARHAPVRRQLDPAGNTSSTLRSAPLSTPARPALALADILQPTGFSGIASLPQPEPASAEAPGSCLRKRALSPALTATEDGMRRLPSTVRQLNRLAGKGATRKLGLSPPRRRHRVGAMCGGKLPACGASRRGPGMPPASAVQACAGQRPFLWAKVWQAGHGAHRPSRTHVSAARTGSAASCLCHHSRGQRRAEASLGMPRMPAARSRARRQGNGAMGRYGGQKRRPKLGLGRCLPS